MDSTVNCDVTIRAEKQVKRERPGTRLDKRLIWRKKSVFKNIRIRVDGSSLVLKVFLEIFFRVRENEPR